MVEEQFPDVLFLQESMGDGKVIAAEMEPLLNGWFFVSVDTKGKSGGLLVGWRTRQFQFLNVSVVVSGLCASLYSIELKEALCFVNVYGPYLDRERYWNNFFLSGLSKEF